MKVVFVFAVLLAVAGVSAFVPLAVNETYVYNYTSALNVSANETFACALNQTLARNESVSLSLVVGEVRSATVGFCSATASCSAGNVSNATCIISRTLAPGEVYANLAGPCAVNISVSAAGNVSAPTGSTVPYRYLVELVNTNGIITFTVGNQTSVADVSRSGVLYRQEVEVQIPANPSFRDLSDEDLEDVDYVVRTCKAWVPLLDDTVTALVDNAKTCQNSARSHVDDVKLCGERERGLLAQIGTLTGERDAAVSQREIAEAARSEAEREEAVARGDATAYEFLMWLFVASSVVFAGALVAVVVTGRQRRRGAE